MAPEATVKDTENATQWREAAYVLFQEGEGKVNGETTKVTACASRCIELGPKDPENWLCALRVAAHYGSVPYHGMMDAVPVMIVNQMLDKFGPAHRAAALYEVAIRINADTEVEIDGRKVSGRDCYMWSLREHASAKAWLELGNNIDAGEEVPFKPTTDPLGHQHPKGEEDDAPKGEPWALQSDEPFKGHAVTRLQCYVEAATMNFAEGVEDDTVWFNLSAAMGRSETVTVGGRTFTRQECMRRYLALDPTGQAVMWAELGNSMTAQEEVRIEGKVDAAVSQERCFVNALGIDQDDCTVWFNLGNGLEGRTAEINGKTFGRKECYAQALSLQPKLAIAWNNLGSSLEKGETVTLRNNTVVDKLKCYTQAIEVAPGDGLAWGNLGAELQESDATAKVGGVDVDVGTCFIKAVELQPGSAQAWYNIGTLANAASASVTVDGKTLTAAECYARSLDIAPAMADVWFNLGVALMPEAGTAEAPTLRAATVGGVGQVWHQCFVRVLELDAQYDRAWFNLGFFHGPVTVGDGSYTRKQCFARAIELGGGGGTAWLNLARMLEEEGEGATVDVSEKTYNASDCLMWALSAM